MSRTTLLAPLLAALLAGPAPAQERAAAALTYKTEKDLAYRTGADVLEAARERCRLDLYYPENVKGFPTVVWFHGGGLTGGSKSTPAGLKDQGFAVAAANYRLSPKAKSPAYIEDAAAAVAWTVRNIEKYGGSPKLVFVSGHSAGGYLTSMVGLDRRWLKPHGLDPNDLAGLIPLSGQCITHFTVRAERGLPDTQPVIDDLAPLYHVRKDAPPVLLVTGDREKELLGRYEETAYLWRMLKVVGHPEVELVELKGQTHGGMAGPALPLVVRFVREHAGRGGRPRARVEFRRAETAPAEGLTEVTVSGSGNRLYLHKTPDLTAADLAAARLGPAAEPRTVEITFTEEGAKKAARLSEQHAGKPLAVLVDGKVLMAPVLRARLGSKAVLSGVFDEDLAARLVKVLGGR